MKTRNVVYFDTTPKRNSSKYSLESDSWKFIRVQARIQLAQSRKRNCMKMQNNVNKSMGSQVGAEITEINGLF